MDIDAICLSFDAEYGPKTWSPFCSQYWVTIVHSKWEFSYDLTQVSFYTVSSHYKMLTKIIKYNLLNSTIVSNSKDFYFFLLANFLRKASDSQLFMKIIVSLAIPYGSAIHRGFSAKNKIIALTVCIVHTYIKIVLFTKE